MNVLVVGGAGYIGSHTARALQQVGHQVWVYDNLSTGHRQAVPAGRLIDGDLCEREHLEEVLERHSIDAVMHFAAFAQVGESVAAPARYYENNVTGTLNLLQAMLHTGVEQIVFSSTTATYGNVTDLPITEATAQQPINPYGYTKLVVERMLDDFSRAYGLSYVALRYFNAAGAAADGLLGEDHLPETHLIPLVLQVALGQRDQIVIFGDDYPTPDRTCVRDYVHVEDLAAAHIQALDHFRSGSGVCLNLGTGRGFSVREIIESCRRVSGCPIQVEVGDRRDGDPPALVADASQARVILGWEPRYTKLDDIVATAWGWHSTHPEGYASSTTRTVEAR